MEAKRWFGVQKCKMQVCRIMKITVNKARWVYLMHVNLSFEKIALIKVDLTPNTISAKMQT